MAQPSDVHESGGTPNAIATDQIEQELTLNGASR